MDVIKISSNFEKICCNKSKVQESWMRVLGFKHYHVRVKLLDQNNPT